MLFLCVASYYTGSHYNANSPIFVYNPTTDQFDLYHLIAGHGTHDMFIFEREGYYGVFTVNYYHPAGLRPWSTTADTVNSISYLDHWLWN